MNFKSWLINELTEVDPKQIAWLSTITPDTLLNYEDVVPFVYSCLLYTSPSPRDS